MAQSPQEVEELILVPQCKDAAVGVTCHLAEGYKQGPGGCFQAREKKIQREIAYGERSNGITELKHAGGGIRLREKSGLVCLFKLFPWAGLRIECPFPVHLCSSPLTGPLASFAFHRKTFSAGSV